MAGMPRRARLEFAGAVYQVLGRGDRREAIFRDDLDRETFLATLGAACARAGWRLHAYVLMDNHDHLLLETQQANLVKGMHWFQCTYTARFNRWHQLAGHLFQGRYKAVVIDPQGRSYFAKRCCCSQKAASRVHGCSLAGSRSLLPRPRPCLPSR